MPDTVDDGGNGRMQGRAQRPRPVVPTKVRAPIAGALPRDRLEARLATATRQRLTLVVGPAGSGKTTLLARFAATAAVPVAWYRAETWDSDEVRLLRHLEAALEAVLPGLRTGWTSIEEAAAALDAWSGQRAILIIDDLHALEGTPAEAALGRLVDYAPPSLAIVAGTRVAPGFNLSRLRVSGELLEIESDDLRFRAWEVERLFRDHYRDPMPPGELALLARRTEGWAAGLQLFHLATRGKPPEERRRILGVVGSRTRLTRDYLTRNVLADLPSDLRDFLIGTCVLGRLTGDLCDRLLDQRGSARRLDELARRQIFTVAVDDAEGSYRYHEVLRAHLDEMLVEEVGEAEARSRHAAAGALLEASGALPEALAAYCRAEDWAAVGRLLGDRGEQVAGGADLHLERLPPSLVRHDPWLALASARRARAEGRWSAAIEAYTRAESSFGAADTGTISRRERQALTAWLDPVAFPPADWTGALRSGLIKEPATVVRESWQLDDAHQRFVQGMLLLAAGDVVEARRALMQVAELDGLGSGPAIGAAIAAGVAALLAGDSQGEVEIDVGVDAAERAGLTWLARIGKVAGRLAGGETADADQAAEAFRAEEDPWGSGLAALAEAWSPGDQRGDGPMDDSADRAEQRAAAGERAAGLFRRLGSGVLEAWARGLGAFGGAEAALADARESALAAEGLARVTAVAGPRLLAYAALRLADSGRVDDYDALIDALVRETGLVLPPSTRENQDERAGAMRSGLRITTFGLFEVRVDGRLVALDGIKPRARSVLRLLAIHPGVAVHREVIQEALWPDVEAQAGAKSLHVAISALRGLFAEALGRQAANVVVRDGDAYRLALEPDAVDIGRLEVAAAEARSAKARGDIPAALASLRRVLDLHAAELLPEDGPAEWVVERREHLRRGAVEAARTVAEAALLDHDFELAVSVSRMGLALDRYHDPLWRLLIAARERAGDPGAAGRDRLEYEAVLAGLGVAAPPAISSA